MIFNKVIDKSDFSSGSSIKITKRIAVRAVILKGNNLLMVHSKLGDYKFPGGGVKALENYDEALKREVLEETGYRVKTINEKLGVIVERFNDSYEENCIFEMVSHYYLCTIEVDKTNQSLDDYEADLEFKPEFVDIEKAIIENKELLQDESREKRAWTQRETLALSFIKEELGTKKAGEC
ncbi:NUDIX domain-containing protein [Clostridium cavendishii DSM 21758]|uniref:NUDIX domain-containing protein n=1 Tax=Clostridium cavendishii DSM 21758 TaxID=1121302 RepID=A0A1M6V712_9CLOT|nr:NUDIX domain-containing protein [Clostridium cavendishii]SHK77253.1 NUDIX domain-containing protein [Clostridium cavendishii DSM 21758]